MDLEVLSPRRRKQFAALLGVAFAAVFAIDVFLPLGYAAAMLYSLLVFAATVTGRVRWVVATSGAAVVATLVAIPFKPRLSTAVPASAVVFNRASITLMLVAAAAIGSLVVVRSARLTAVSGRLSSTSDELERQEKLSRAASKVGKVAGWSLDREEGSSIVWSDEVQRIFGMSPGQRTLRDDVLAFVDDDGDRARLLEAGLNCLRDGTPFLETFRATGGDGRHLWLTVMGEATRDDHGRIVGLAGALQDVTLWKEAEATAAAQQRRFAQFANSLPAIIWTGEPSGEIDYFSDAFTAYTGQSEGDLLADQWVRALHPDDVEGTVGEWQRALATGEPYSTAFRLLRADGEYRWFRVAAQAERADDGRIVKWWGNTLDVHEFHLLEIEATRLARDLDGILNTGDLGVFTLDPELRFTYVNGRAQSMLGRSADELLGVVITTLYPQFASGVPADTLAAARATGETQHASEYDAVLGMWIDATVTATPEGFTVYFRDITELRSVTEQLAQAQRMESVGRLTGGIAHDFNNLLTVVVGGAEALTDDPGLTDDGRELLGLVTRAATRGAELTHQLLAFSRQQPLAPQPVDVSTRIREMAPILSRAIGPGITEVAELEEGLPTALVDPGQLDSAILNLAINARDAMPTGGTLTVTAAFAHLEESYSTAHTDVLPGDYVVVSVGDTGMGIAGELLPRIFEPFFTTKAAGEGSGLGLSMVWGFMKQTGGHVTVYSEEGLGSTFRLYLPVATESATPTNAPAPNPRTPSRGSGHILLAEDDPLVRAFAARRLLDHGFEVTVASTGVEALEFLAGIETLALLFTDVIMVGGVSGRDLADEVVARRPGTPVLYASGYTEDVMVHQGRLDPGVALLAKPYTGRQLLERVHAALAGRGMGAES